MDPYHSYRYDFLHVDDIGKFGKHLFGTLIEYLGTHGILHKLSDE
jgi:hypothetical protein